MKKLPIIVFLLVLTVMSSCSKFLDRMPDDQLTIDMIFSDRIRTEDWLASCYQSIPSPMWGYYQHMGNNIMSDEMTIPAPWQQWGWGASYAYTIGNWNPTTVWPANYWIELPRRIRTGLIFLQNVRVQPEKDMDQALVDRMKYEVRFLNAYYYSLLLESHGPIPFKPGVITANDAPTSELMIGQSPVDSIVNWIDTELKEVSQHLPAVYPHTAWGSATSIMCLAVRARTLMYAASPLFNGNPDYASFVNNNGTNLFSTSYDPEKWTRAAAANKELIDAAHAAGHRLYKEYNDDGSIDPFMSYYNLSLRRVSDGNDEILFGRPENLDLNNWQRHHLPTGIGGNGGLGVSQELVDAFFMKNGLPISHPESGYSESGFSTEGEVRNTKWRGAEGLERIVGQVTQPGTFNMYCNREPRFYVSVIYNEAWLGVANRRANFFLFGQDGGPSFDAPQNGYNVRKRISLETFPREGRHPYQPGIIYRLAEAYLSYAEALNESSPGNPDILQYLNLVRERAGVPALESGSQEDMREAIRAERRVEFNCEGIRFHDIRRWKIGEQALNRDMFGMNFNGTERSDDVNNPNAYFKRTYHRRRIFTKNMYFWPVPQSQIDINPNLVQMPGY